MFRKFKSVVVFFKILNNKTFHIDKKEKSSGVESFVMLVWYKLGDQGPVPERCNNSIPGINVLE